LRVVLRRESIEAVRSVLPYSIIPPFSKTDAFDAIGPKSNILPCRFLI
jgi:hypothetical protein